MNWLNRSSIKKRLIVLVALMMMPTVALGLLGLYGMGTSNASLGAVYHDHMTASGQIRRIGEIMVTAMVQVHLATKHDPRLEESVLHRDHTVKKHTDAIRKLRGEIDDHWKMFLATNLSEEEQRTSTEYEKKIRTFQEALDRAIILIEAEEFKEVNELSVRVLQPAFNEAKGERLVRGNTQEGLLDLAKAAAEERFVSAERLYRIVFILTVVTIVSSLLVFSILGALLVRSVTVPLSQAVERMKDLAEGEGDLTKRLDAGGHDEIGEMSRWINRFIENVQGIVREIAGTTNEVRESSTQLAGVSQSLSAGIEQMSAQSRSISASATEMNQNFQVISSSVEEMSTSVGEVARNASDASRIAREANQVAAGANSNIKQLGDDAKEIGKVVESIQGIAAQTNLLALNAAIEAAGAGDAGKGFAVVASEVKELARQASESTEEIKTRIQAIQMSSKTAVQSIGQIATVIGQVNEFTTTIASAVEEQSITAREIAGNVNQATQASGDVVQNISGISTAAQEGATNAQGMSDLAVKMENLSGRLDQIVRRFRL